MTPPKIIIDSLGHKSDHEGESTVSDSDKNGELDVNDQMDNSKSRIIARVYNIRESILLQYGLSKMNT